MPCLSLALIAVRAIATSHTSKAYMVTCAAAYTAITLLCRYVTFSGTVTLDFSVANKASYTVSAHATGVYQVNIVDLSGARQPWYQCMHTASLHPGSILVLTHGWLGYFLLTTDHKACQTAIKSMVYGHSAQL